MAPTLTEQELQAMQEMDIFEIDRNQLVDIDEIRIDESAPVEQRIQSFLSQAGNPYFVKSGEYVLKFQYAKDGKTVDECMVDYASKLAKIRF